MSQSTCRKCGVNFLVDVNKLDKCPICSSTKVVQLIRCVEVRDMSGPVHKLMYPTSGAEEDLQQILETFKLIEDSEDDDEIDRLYASLPDHDELEVDFSEKEDSRFHLNSDYEVINETVYDKWDTRGE